MIGRVSSWGSIGLAVLAVVSIGCNPSGCGPGGGTTPTPVVSRFAFVVDTMDGIASYAIDAPTGILRTNGVTLLPAPTSAQSVSPSNLGPALAPAMVVNPAGFIHLVARSTTPSATLVVAAIDAPTGRLSPRTLAWPGGIPLDIVGHPSGKFLYVIDANSEIQAAGVDQANGDLTPIGMPASLASLRTAQRVSIDPQGKYLIATGRDGTNPANVIDQVGTLAIDPATGAPQSAWRRVPLPFDPGAVVVHPSDTCGLVLPSGPATQMASFAISSAGAPSGVTSTMVPLNFTDLVFDPSGTAVFALSAESVTTIPIADATTCALGTPSAPVALTTIGATRLSLEPSGRFLYATDTAKNQIDALAITRQTTRGGGPVGTPSLSSIGRFPARPGLVGFAPVFAAGATPVSYTPAFLYVVNQGSNDISIFSVASTGALTAAGRRTSLGVAPSAIAIDPWSRFAYVANRDSGTVAAFTIDRGHGGALSATTMPTFAGTHPIALAVDPSGQFLFVADNGSSDVRVFTINQSTGQLSAAATSTFPMSVMPTSLAIDPTGTTLYVSNDGPVARLRAFIIDHTGSLVSTVFNPEITIGGFTGIAVDPRGEALIAGDTGNNSIPIARIGATRVASINGTVLGGFGPPTGKSPVSVAVDPLGRFVYTANIGDFSTSTYSIDRSTSLGSVSILLTAGPAPVGSAPPRPRAAIVDPSGRFLYVAGELGDVFKFSINQSTGALTGTGSVTAGANPFALAIARW